MRRLLLLSVLLLAACGSEPTEAPTPEPTPEATAEVTPAPTKVEPREKPTVTVEKPKWKDGEGNPVEAPTPRKVKRWNGLVTGNWKDPLPHVSDDERCVVLHALAGSPAAEAGLQEMDVIVVSEGVPVKKYQDYIAGARKVEVGDTMDLEIVRDGKRMSVAVPMLEKPKDMIRWRKEHFPGTDHPAWELPLLRGEGETMSSAGAGDSYQVLYFWATWCGPCRRTSPVVSKLHDELGGKGVQVIGISSEEEPVIRAFMEKNTAYAYPVGWDSEGAVKRDYEVKKLPTIVLVGKDGKVLDWDISVSGVNRVTNKVRKLLTQPG